MKEIINFGKEGNVYLNEKAPWHLIKEDKAAAGHVFNLCAQAVYALAILLGPFIPGTSIKILEYLNILEKLNDLSWDSINENSLKAGKEIRKPLQLFKKLEVKDMQEKLKKLKEKKGDNDIMDEISYDDFKKLDLRIGMIEKVEMVPNADKLLKLTVDIGTEKRTLVAGLAEYYDAEELKGQKIVVLTNLQPRKLRGVESQGMLLAAEDGKIVSFLTPEKDVSPGSKIR